MLVDIQIMSHGKASFIDIETEIGPDELTVSFQGIRLTSPPFFTGRLTADGDGVFILDGCLTAGIAGECARCLASVRRPLEVKVDEVFRPVAAQNEAEPDDSYPYEGFVVELLPALRDNLVLAFPQRLLCREDCKGICPECGADLNETTCTCAAGRSEANAPFNQLKQLL
jgi:uncharacterized protein